MRNVPAALVALVLAIPWPATAAERFEPLPPQGLRIGYDSCIPLPAMGLQILIGKCFVDTPFVSMHFNALSNQLTLVHWTTLQMRVSDEIREAIQKMLPEKNRGTLVNFVPEFPSFRGRSLPLPILHPLPLSFAATSKDTQP